VLADADLAAAKFIRQPARHDRHQPLMVAHMGFVGADKVHMGQFMRDDAAQVARDGVGVEPDDAALVVGHALT
jgi:hypothetical protein